MHLTRSAATLAGAVAVALALLTGCASTTTPLSATTGSSSPPEALAPIRVASLKGPTTMGLVALMDEATSGEVDARGLDVDVTVHGTADEVVPLLVQGQVDVALIPANLASVLYHRTLTDAGPQIQVAAVNTLGVLDVVEAGQSISSIADLAGRTVYSTGKGTTPELVLDHLLRANGLEPGVDVTVEFKSEATEVAALLASEPGAVGVLPQPYVTVLTAQQPSMRRALSLTDEWDAVTPGSRLVTGVLVVRSAFAVEHPATLDAFLTAYEASTAWTNANPAAAATLITEAGITPNAAVAEAAIPACHITFLAGDELVEALGGYLTVLHSGNPESVGGRVPGDDFYLRR